MSPGPMKIAASVVLLAASVSAQPGPEARTSRLKAANGQEMGQVPVTATPHGGGLRLQARGLPPGWHGMHFHDKADCSDPAFKRSGGHIHARTPAIHGILNASFNDAGDLPNLYVSPDGSSTVELYSTWV